MDRFFFFLFFRSVRLRARARAERRGNKETTLAKRTDFKTDDFTKRERERKEERREKEHARDERERSNRPITVAAPFSSSLVACYSLLSLTDKPAGSGDANLQLLLRPVRLGAVDPSQGVLLARGVRSFRISHSCVIVSWCVVGLCCLLWGQKEDKKSCSEGNNFPRAAKHFCSFSFILLSRRQKAEGRGGRARVFSSFFVRFFFEHSALSLLSLSFLSLFSLFSLKLVRVFARILSTRKLFGGGSKRQSSSSSFLIIKVNNNTRARFTS